MNASAVEKYAERLQADVDRVISLTPSLTEALEIGDPKLRRTFRLEGIALASHWVQSFSAATPEMAKWATAFCQRLEEAPDVQQTFTEVGFPTEAENFVPNRIEYYQANGAKWQLDESLLASWTGVLNFSALFAKLRMPPMFGPGQKAEFLLQRKTEDKAKLDTIYGLDSQSQEFSDLIGDSLNAFLQQLAAIVSESNKAFIAAVVESKAESASSGQTNELRYWLRGTLIAATVWCGILGAVEFYDDWVYQLSRIAVTGIAIWAAIGLLERLSISLGIVAVLFNPILPIDFDDDAWRVVCWISAAVFALAAYRCFAQHPTKTNWPNKTQQSKPR